MKTTLVNLRLEDKAVAVLDHMAGDALNRQAVARMLLIAAIEAVQANGGRIELPPRFVIPNETRVPSYSINEPQRKNRT